MLIAGLNLQLATTEGIMLKQHKDIKIVGMWTKKKRKNLPIQDGHNYNIHKRCTTAFWTSIFLTRYDWMISVWLDPGYAKHSAEYRISRHPDPAGICSWMGPSLCQIDILGGRYLPTSKVGQISTIDFLLPKWSFRK